MRPKMVTESAVPYSYRVRVETKTRQASVLTINGGSSSIRFALFNAGGAGALLLSGKVDRIGLPGTILSASVPGRIQRMSRRFSAPDHRTAARRMLGWIRAQPLAASIEGVGHRIVHGMDRSAPQRVTPRLVRELRGAIPFAPDHLPIELELIEACG